MKLFFFLFSLFIILFCLLTIITLTQPAKVMKLHNNIILNFTINHIFFSHQYIYQQYTLYKYMLLNTTCINILY